MYKESKMTVEDIIEISETEFKDIKGKFTTLKILDGKRKLDYTEIEHLALPSPSNNIIWHPVFMFSLEMAILTELEDI